MTGGAVFDPALFAGKKKGAFAGVRNRILLSQQQERMTQIAEMIGATMARLSDDPVAESEMVEIAKKVTFMLGAMNDILDRSRSDEIRTMDFDDENLDIFLKDTTMIASLIESALYKPGDVLT